MDRLAQQAEIKRSIAILEGTTDQRPAGWVGPGARANETTIELLADEGFLYCCEYQDDEFPYHVMVEKTPLVIIPFRFDGNPTDLRIFNPNAARDPDEAYKHLKIVFDCHYKAAAKTPLIFYYGVHPFVSGRPERAEVLDRFVKYVKGFPDVWISTRKGIAEWYKETTLASAGMETL
jgi:peptidoglycan/xylan/chitin deacetylase (PgdA/CDA1 family)